MKNTIIKKTLVIQIIDDDKFYTAGLVMALSNHLINLNIKARFYTSPFTGVTADITFQGIRCGTIISPDNLRCISRSTTFFYAITDRKDAHLQHLYRGFIKSNILYRHQSVSCVLQLVANTLLSPLPPPDKKLKTVKSVLHKQLTPREQEVLHQLKQGKTPASVASFLGIKEKTISSHKRAAMRKLNFKRTNELFHWMLQGGLTCHQQRKGI
ncbi:helix-turn-helix transcriptional regulator [Serratia marcescens]|uniref:helix-turn-helix transcriptional regulator n=1 Tax=Serratia marcescens TaxID=615 RepID=UPI000975E14A|nr:helix-turn-helix transcriptional regulator [Serratia marcescens]MDY7605645.1 helix-turn-helix transcriptional regulator [Serratia marcescens]